MATELYFHGKRRLFPLLFADLLDLTDQLATRAIELGGEFSTWAKNLTDQHTELFGTTGPLTDFLDAINRQLFAIHDSAASFKFWKLHRVFVKLRHFLDQRDKILAPQTTA